MVYSVPDTKNQKDQIIQVALKHFAHYGYEGANLNKIADEARVANSLIHYHFKNKEGLFKSCLASAGQKKLDLIKRALQPADSFDEFVVRIKIFIEDFISSYFEDPCALEIVYREVKSGDPQVLELFKDSIFVVYNTFLNFFKLAQKSKLIRSDIDADNLTRFLFGIINDTCRNDEIGKTYFSHSLKNKKYREQFINDLIKVFVDGVKK